jgi:hypothetical protein
MRGQGPTDSQMPLLPLPADAEFPATFRTADLKTIVRARDGHFYAVKSASEDALLPASEFLCYRLASACHVAVPFSTVLETKPGEFAFGSRFEGETTDAIVQGPTRTLEMLKDCSNQVSATLAFDMFVGNEDRHFGNFLFRPNVKSQWAPLAIDYSRAFLVRGFPDDHFPLPVTCKTRTTINQLKRADLWRGPYAVIAVGALQQVTAEHILHWLDEMPSGWLPTPQRVKLIQWWGSTQFQERLNALYDLL